MADTEVLALEGQIEQSREELRKLRNAHTQAQANCSKLDLPGCTLTISIALNTGLISRCSLSSPNDYSTLFVEELYKTLGGKLACMIKQHLLETRDQIRLEYIGAMQKALGLSVEQNEERTLRGVHLRQKTAEEANK